MCYEERCEAICVTPARGCLHLSIPAPPYLTSNQTSHQQSDDDPEAKPCNIPEYCVSDTLAAPVPSPADT